MASKLFRERIASTDRYSRFALKRRYATLTTALAHLVIVVLIGAVAGIVMYRGLGRLAGGDAPATHAQVTYMLVGIAGGFIGFHIGVVLELLPIPAMLYLLAVVGAFLTLFLWRGR